MNSRRLRAASVALAILALSACAGTPSVDVRDPRFDAEQRHLVSSAEDGTLAAQMAVQAAQARAARFEETAERMRSSVNLDAATDRTLVSYLDANLARLRAEQDLAQAEFQYARARGALATAVVAMAADVDTFDVEGLEQEVSEQLELVLAARRALEARRGALEEARGAWWAAYRSYVAGGGDRSTLWTSAMPVSEVEFAMPELGSLVFPGDENSETAVDGTGGAGSILTGRGEEGADDADGGGADEEGADAPVSDEDEPAPDDATPEAEPDAPAEEPPADSDEPAEDDPDADPDAEAQAAAEAAEAERRRRIRRRRRNRRRRQAR